MARIDRFLALIILGLGSVPAVVLAIFGAALAMLGVIRGQPEPGGAIFTVVGAAPVALGWRGFARGNYPVAAAWGMALIVCEFILASAFVAFMSFG